MTTRGPLFGSATTGPGSTAGNKHLVEMRAGKMNLRGHTVYPDTRKGLLYVYQSEDSLMHFCWQDRTSGVVEDDLIIFPDDCEYVRVPQCTTGRVYLLKFKSSNRRFFFWLQEPSVDKDEENCKRINDILNNPSTSVPSSNNVEQDLHSLLHNMSQSQLMQILGGGQMGGLSSLLGTISRPSTGGSARTSSNTAAITHRTAASTPTTNTALSSTPAAGTGGATTTAATTPTTTTAASAAPLGVSMTPPSVPVSTPGAPTKGTTTRSSSSNVRNTPILTGPDNAIQLSDLRNFLLGLAPPNTETANVEHVDLSTALTGDAMSSIMSNQEALEHLQQHLPEVEGSAQEQLRSTLQSPQFQQAVSQFSSALESGQLGPVVSQLTENREAVAAANVGNIQGFVEALEKASEEPKEGASSAKKDSGPKKDKDNEKDDSMQLD